MELRLFKDTRAGLGWVLLAVFWLSGCRTPPPPPPPEPVFPKSYVVLLPSPDGSVGQVVVEGSQGQQVLQAAMEGAGADGAPLPRPVDEARLASDFGAVRAGLPPLPEQFMLYFESGGSKLTPESEALVNQVLQRVRERAAMGMVDVSVVGHSDTVGRAETNERVSLERAQMVAALLKQAGLDGHTLSVESHGEKNLLVATPDETPEPRNRRVEITLR